MRRNYRSARASRQPLLAILFASSLAPGIASAEFTVSAGAEYFKWEEATTPTVEETGPMLALGIGYTQDRDSGLVFGYRGKLWSGSADYEGSTLFGNTLLSGTTDYVGIGNELQLRLRKAGDSSGWLDALLGAGLDAWRRQLSTIQKEDFQVGYIRLGVESGEFEAGKWSVAMGLKLPVWARENAHLDQLGFDSNPRLEPRKDMSSYASIGYHVTDRMQVVAYYDSFRFKRSEDVNTTATGLGLGQVTLFQPSSTLSVIGLKLEYQAR